MFCLYSFKWKFCFESFPRALILPPFPVLASLTRTRSNQNCVQGSWLHLTRFPPFYGFPPPPKESFRGHDRQFWADVACCLQSYYRWGPNSGSTALLSWKFHEYGPHLPDPMRSMPRWTGWFDTASALLSTSSNGVYREGEALRTFSSAETLIVGRTAPGSTPKFEQFRPGCNGDGFPAEDLLQFVIFSDVNVLSCPVGHCACGALIWIVASAEMPMRPPSPISRTWHKLKHSRHCWTRSPCDVFLSKLVGYACISLR